MNAYFGRFFTFICSFFFFSSNAQFQGKVYELSQSAQVVANGTMQNSPWCGGINSTQFNLADLNQDGKPDLVIYDHNNYLIRTFLNTGTTGDIRYTYAPKYEQNFPVIYNYMLLKDYNCDGITDLFHKSITGVSVYKGYYIGGELKFSFYKDLYYPGMFGPVNVFVQPDDIPAIRDVDGDGDLDVVSFNVNGTFLEYARNMQVELGLPCDTMRMELADACYGKFFQGVQRTVNIGVSCKANVSERKKTRHTGNCFILVDIEGDGDLDFLGGNISFSDAQLLFNTGSSSNASYTLQDTLYNSAGHMLHLPSWPAPFHIDIDQDGDHDILFTPHNDNNSSANYNVVAYYKNTGTDLLPNFVYQHDSLLTMDMIDVGSFSAPVFFDFDKDGRKDLFVGTEGYLNNATETHSSMIAHYKNVSVGSTIAFELVTKDFLGLSAFNYEGIFPTFGDLTGDGIDDLVMGNINGSISLYKNYAPSNTASPNFLLFTDSIPGIDVGMYSMPCVYDFNQDGKTDLLIGNQAGYIYYFQDTSSTSQKKLSLQTISLGDVRAGDLMNIYGYCAPFIGKMDNTGKDFLLVGNIDGTIARYDTFINNMGTFSRIDSNYSEIQTPMRSTVAIDDLNNDGVYEMVVGNKLGGLRFYRQVKNVLLETAAVNTDDISIDVFPNPAQASCNIFIHSSGLLPDEAHVNVTDISGKQVLSKTIYTKANNRLDITHLSEGLYLLDIRVEGKRYSKKLVVQGK
jgi:hypothetical protein